MIKTILILMLVPLVASGAYYISPTGDDNANGTTWETAWQTIEKLNYEMTAGDTVFFASGTWYNSQIRPPQGGDINHQTVYACSTFNLDSKHLAKIYGAEIVTDWIQHNGNIYRKQWTGTNCYEYGCGSLVQDLEPLQLIDPDYIDLDSGRYYYQNGYIYVWCYENKDPNNCQMLASCKPPLYFGKTDISYVRFWGLDLRYGQQATVFFNSRTNHISIGHCNIGSAGHTSANACGVFASANEGGKHAPDSSTFGHYNTIRSCNIGNLRSMLCSWARIGTGDGIIIYSEKYFTVDSCYFYPPFGTGINFKGKGAGTTLEGNVAKFNTIVGASRHGIDIWVHPYKDSIYGNYILWSGTHGIFIHTSSDPWMGDIFIANNTIYNSGDRGIEIWDDGDRGECGSGVKIIGNIIDIAFVGMAFDYFGGTNCEDSSVVDNNLYHWITRGNESSCGWTWDSWQNCGFDINGLWNIDPLFYNPNGLDFSREVGQELDYYIGDWHITNYGAIQNVYGYVCGDANNSGFVDIDDVVYILDYAFLGATVPVPIEAGDTNGNGHIDIDDAIYLLEYIFNNGAYPVCEEL